MSLRYRPEIDGMRAIAVIAVILYHLKISFSAGYFLPGGFLGVDVFFVLSGYLITGLILKELNETNTFSFLNFYSRRTRRILPALLLVMIFSMLVAWTQLLPTELTRFAKSLIAALAFVSNVFWFFTLGEYGAQSGLLQPFLHTWSLSIEEQFYFIFPLLLFGVHKLRAGRCVKILLYIFLVSSFVAAQITTTHIHAFLSFYSPVSRAWEMLAGSLLAYLEIARKQGGLQILRVTRWIPAASVMVLVYSFSTVSLEASSHPGFTTIPVVLASCALIWFAQKGEPVTQLLSSKTTVWVGKLSYSLYLWHFPIFAFGRMRLAGDPTLLDYSAWLALTAILSWLGYVLVERPFRLTLSTKAFVSAIVGSLVLVATFSFVVIRYNGFPQRLADVASLYGKNEIDNQKLAYESTSILRSLSPGEVIGEWNAGTASQHERNDLWFTPQARKKILVIGNSHSKDVFNALYQNKEALDGIEVARFALAQNLPDDEFGWLYASPNFAAADIIIFAPKYNRLTVSALSRKVEEIIGKGKQVVLLGNAAEFTPPGTLPIFDWYIRRENHAAVKGEVDRLAFQYEGIKAKSYNREIEQIADTHGIPYLDRRNLMCDDASKVCEVVTPDNMKAMFDGDHWTLEGAKFFGARMITRWFRSPPFL